MATMGIVPSIYPLPQNQYLQSKNDWKAYVKSALIASFRPSSCVLAMRLKEASNLTE